MEKITFEYKFEDVPENSTDTQTITMVRRDADGLMISDVCEMFEDFLNAVGFSIEQVKEYFAGE